MEKSVNTDKMAQKPEGTVRKILALSILILFVTALAHAGANLLNYEKDAKVVVRGVCDNGQTKVILYEHSEYDLKVAVTASGETYLYFDADEGEKFFIKLGDKTVEMSHEAWDAGLRSASLSFYASIHGGQNDCRKVN